MKELGIVENESGGGGGRFGKGNGDGGSVDGMMDSIAEDSDAER